MSGNVVDLKRAKQKLKQNKISEHNKKASHVGIVNKFFYKIAALFRALKKRRKA